MISYSEPLHDKWVAQARFSSNFILGKNIVDATNADGTNNDYYSSFTNNRYFNERGHLTVEYSHNASTLQFGLQADAVMSEITSKSMGITTTTGKNEWLLNWAPFIYYLYNKNGINVYVTYSGYSNNSSGSSITPALNISNPVQITAGNIYLKPQYTHSIYSSLRHNNRETFSFISATLSYRLATRANVQASWMDGTGVRYSIPVNALKPQTTASAYITYRRPITKDRQLTLELKANSTSWILQWIWSTGMYMEHNRQQEHKVSDTEFKSRRHPESDQKSSKKNICRVHRRRIQQCPRTILPIQRLIQLW